MNELIKINTDNSDRPTVSGRELHRLLEIQTPYRSWFPRMCEYGFTEGVDYTPYNFVHPQNRQEITDHQLTIDMAKEICMIQRSDIGKRCRQYFLDIERKWNSPELTMARALTYANQKLLDATAQIQQLTVKNEQLTVANEELHIKNIQQEQQIDQLRPAADYTNKVLNSLGLLNVTQIAQDYGVSAKVLNQWLYELHVQFYSGGQWILYAPYKHEGYVQSVTYYTDGVSGTHTKWTQKGREFIYRILKEKKGIVPLSMQYNQPKPLF